MQTTKTEFKFFTIIQWKEEENYLRKMHNNGWAFTCVTFPGFYHFKSCEPDDVIYRLDYNSDGISQKNNYIKMFQDSGWVYLQDFIVYSYFRKKLSAVNGYEDIFYDDFSKFQLAKRISKGRIISMIIFFFCIIISQIFLKSYSGTPIANAITTILVTGGLLSLVIFIFFEILYRKYLEKLKNN